MGLNVDRVLSEFEEDTAASDGATGQYVLAVVQNTLASSAADGDFGSFKVNLKGELYSHDADAVALLGTINTDTGDIASDTGNILIDTNAMVVDLAAIEVLLTSIDADTSTIASDTTSIDVTLTALSQTRDDAIGATDEGMMLLGQRSDSGGSLVSDDGDYTPLSITDTGELRTTAILSKPNTSITSTAVTVGITEIKLPATPATGRDEITIQNRGNTDSVYIGPTGVLTSTGLEISKRSSMTICLGPGVDVFGISDTASQDVRVFEVA